MNGLEAATDGAASCAPGPSSTVAIHHQWITCSPGRLPSVTLGDDSRRWAMRNVEVSGLPDSNAAALDESMPGECGNREPRVQSPLPGTMPYTMIRRAGKPPAAAGGLETMGVAVT